MVIYQGIRVGNVAAGDGALVPEMDEAVATAACAFILSQCVGGAWAVSVAVQCSATRISELARTHLGAMNDRRLLEGNEGLQNVSFTRLNSRMETQIVY